ncbi:hypothetical protein L7F22_035712 [Adiantum nelumboides]|nr:hypothetical protein [Adiantum nelumboides]
MFSSWVASPTGVDRKALAFSAGHCFANEMIVPYPDGELDFQNNKFSEIRGCFGGDTGTAELNILGFGCSTRLMALANNKEVLCLFEISKEKVQQVLLPCSLEVECNNMQPFMATFSYPSTHIFLTQAYEELVEKRASHGTSETYSFLKLDDQDVYELLKDTFLAFLEGTLTCSPGSFQQVNGTIVFYKSSTLGGSNGGPVVLPHFPGYAIGIHKGGLHDEYYNIATSTDSRAFVACYAKYVLPRLPPKDSA